MTDSLKAVVLGLVEGLTEFVPVSSTGHLILVGDALAFHGRAAETFEVFIQSGAMLAVLLVYARRWRELASFRAGAGFHGRRGVGLLILTTLPGLIVGGLAHGVIKEHLFRPATVLVGLAVGGIWILVAERWWARKDHTELDRLSWKQAVGIGLFQCLALWPGMSRSSSTILGGMMLGLKRRAAVEFSFFAAVPLLLAATAYDLYKNAEILTWNDLPTFAIGFTVSFFSAWAAIRFLLRFVARRTLCVFGWYRIALTAILAWVMLR